ncbi:MAG: ACP S-malonyltransferase [Candidatus Sumerlaeia bacterium]|nr:ACP S-malonyltransferase [Candidatus Sumerlaeia bacterium]
MSGKTAFLFPGQGSQASGMGKDAAERNPQARALFERADAILGLPLTQLCFEGPEDKLKPTEITQPALYVSSAATLEVLRAAGHAPGAVAGHSLGEYTALYAAGVFDFETGLRLVRARGLAMAEAGTHAPGAMAAILGLDGAKVEELCAAASDKGVVVAANFNDPGQTVVSGSPEGVAALCEAAKAAGAKRALPLPVSGAFHSPLVQPAAETMRAALADAKLQPPACLFINNADAKALSDPEAIRDSLVRQVVSPVRWVASVEALSAAGFSTFVEVGAGKVLKGLVGRIRKEAVCHSTEGAAAMDAALAALAAG